jgi:hypothetical protein
MRYSGNQRFAYRFNGSHFRRHAQATFNFGQPRSEDRGKGSAGANLGRRTTLNLNSWKRFPECICAKSVHALPFAEMRANHDC